MDASFETILIGTSLDEASDAVVTAGLEIARAAGARVFLAHAHQRPWGQAGSTDLTEEGLERMLEMEEVLACRMKEQILRLGLREEELAGTAIEDGPAHWVLIDVADHCDAGLIVIGATGSPRRSKLFGSTADRVIRHSAAPVLMVRDRLRAPLRRVLMPVDLTPLSAAVFRQGLNLLRRIVPEEAMLEAVMVLDGHGRQPGEPRELSLAAEITALADLERFVARNAVWRKDRIATWLICHGVEEEIWEQPGEWRSDLVVLGADAREGFERLLLGQMAADVVQHGPASVLLIPPAAERVEAELPVAVGIAAADRLYSGAVSTM
ncbi:MAG: universal stress protein [Thermoanaerobaculia bacterium]